MAYRGPNVCKADQATAVAYVRSGATPYSALLAAGVGPADALYLLDPTTRIALKPAMRRFVLQLFKAQGQCRVTAEVEVRKDKPLDWLLKGPGRACRAAPGWSNPPSAGLFKSGADEVATLEVLWRTLAELRELVEAEPGLRQILDEALDKLLAGNFLVDGST